MIFTSKRADLVVREIVDELLVQASSGQEWHALDARAAAVFVAVDGRRDVDAVAAASGTDADTAVGILTELADLGLVGAPAGFDRRAMLRRSAVVLGSAGIMTVLAPATLAAASTAGPRFGIRASASSSLFITEAAVATAAATMTTPTTAAEKRRATFVASNALAPLAPQMRVSYQSLDRTGAYLRHAGEILYVNPGTGSPFIQDATFEITAALNLDPTLRSLRAVTTNYETYYIRRASNNEGAELRIVPFATITANGQQALASFFLQPGGPA